MLEIELLDRAKAVTGSDNSTAKRLGTSRQRLSHIRTGIRGMDEWVAGEIAEIIGDDPIKTICKLRETKASTHKEKVAWKRWAGAAMAVLTTTLFCANGFESAVYALLLPAIPLPNLYIMRIFRCVSVRRSGQSFSARRQYAR